MANIHGAMVNMRNQQNSATKIDWGAYFPALTTFVGVGLNIIGAISVKTRRERLIQMTDERIALEMEFAAHEEVFQVESLSWDEQVAWSLAFNTDQIDSQSYREVMLSKFNGPLAQRESLARRREEFNQAKHFEALDAREGADIGREELFASALSDGFNSFIAGASLLDKVRAMTAAGDMSGLSKALMEEDMAQHGRNKELDALNTKRITMQIEEMRRRMEGSTAAGAAAFFGAVNAPSGGRGIPSRGMPPGLFGAMFASNKQQGHPGINTGAMAGQF